MYKIKFKDQDYFFIGDTPQDGAIALAEDYYNFAPSFAHLFPNGEIKRYNRIIGTREDIQFLEKVED